MRIVKAEINWYGEGQYANQFPQPHLTIEDVPSYTDMIHEVKETEEGIAYFGELDGMVHFCFSNSNKSGYGGATFHIPTKDGVVDVKGPWSSSSSSMNGLGFTPSMDGTYFQADGSYKTLKFASHFTVELIQRLIDDGMFPEGTKLEPIVSFGNPSWQIYDGNRFESAMDIPHLARYARIPDWAGNMSAEQAGVW